MNSHLGHIGQQPVGLTEKLVDSAGCNRRVEAELFDRGADDQPAVGARHEVDPLGGEDAAADRVGRITPELDHLTLDRPDRRAVLLRQPLAAA